jgi:hypothetical protein|eukprot:3857077-Prymnesium_polylepis.1
MDLEAEAPALTRKNSLRSLRTSFSKKMTTLFPGVVHAWSGVQKSSLVPRFIAEACGTFLLVLSATIETAAPATRTAYLTAEGQPFAVAATVTLLVGVGAPVSGAHFNPALTLALWVGGERTHSNLPFAYVCLQLTAGIAGASVAYALDGYDNGLPVLVDSSAESNVAL